MPWDSVDKWRDEDYYRSADDPVTAVSESGVDRAAAEIGSENWHRLNGPEERDKA